MMVILHSIPPSQVSFKLQAENGWNNEMKFWSPKNVKRFYLLSDYDIDLTHFCVCHDVKHILVDWDKKLWLGVQ
jgi:hypothetical protein